MLAKDIVRKYRAYDEATKTEATNNTGGASRLVSLATVWGAPAVAARDDG
jgi:hypothetical protein